ncbi:MAG: hypothetical protein U0Q15_06100 [Kineosporiaceae bacterium]
MDVLAAVVPSIGVTVLFVIGIRALVQADRRERAARDAVAAPEAGPGQGATPAPDGRD